MIFFILAYLGGALTIVSPCILPVLPFIFARADRSLLTSGLPILAGMAVTFAAVATLAAIGGGWVVAANQYGRYAALALMALFGVTLLFPALSDRLTRPVVGVGARISQSAEAAGGHGTTILSSTVLGAATGLLWAPCAGPILGVILTGAALKGANVQTTLLLVAYAVGAATSLALALVAGGRVFAAMKRSLHAGEWVRRGLGAAVLVAVLAIFFGLDTSLLTQVSLAGTTALEQRLLDRLRPGRQAEAAMNTGSGTVLTAAQSSNDLSLPVEDILPAYTGATAWLNSPPLTAEALKGKVVLVDFWTYSCINCLRSIPYIRAWAEKYKDKGLVVIGVHTPEFAFERNDANVKRAITDLKIGYPVAIDNDYTIWQAFENQYWPAHYFIDVQGHVRYHHYGEGQYARSERVIQQLLKEAGRTDVGPDVVSVKNSGAEAAADEHDLRSEETYVGSSRAENFASPEGMTQNTPRVYSVGALNLNQWALSGNWNVGPEHADLEAKDGAIMYRFHARDLHLVLGPAPGRGPIRFRVTIDGKPPAEDDGTDVDARGEGVVDRQRLYQLVRQHGDISDHTFEVEFLDPGVQAYAFTFG